MKIKVTEKNKVALKITMKTAPTAMFKKKVFYQCNGSFSKDVDSFYKLFQDKCYCFGIKGINNNSEADIRESAKIS